MPTKHHYRLWCTHCQEWELFTAPVDEDLKCTTCDSVVEDVKLSDIPDEKIQEQRKRYRKQELHQLRMAMIMFSTGGIVPSDQITEHDAGQKLIDEKKLSDIDKERIFRHDEKEKYKNHERNALCLCESGKKYKKCCMARIDSYR